ncbi:MAG: radical SAM protein [Deltaproteobacteria bacterium]|nr:radical SAM protein [Deltaproteobacteria bacterium]
MHSASKKARPFIAPVFLPQEGCPHRCIFCDQKGATGITQAPPLTPSGVREAVEGFLPFCGPDRGKIEIAFYGGNFLGLAPERAEELLAEAARYVSEGRADCIRLSTRPDTISGQSLDLCEKYPVAVIEVGVQSMDDAVLSACNRGHSADCARIAVQKIKARGIGVGVHLMVGLPGETADSLAATARAVAEMAPDFVRIHPTLVVSESPLEKIWRTGGYRTLSLEQAVARTLIVYEVMEGAGIKVARMGLFTPQGQACESILAGPVHPAFGHLVQSESFRKKAAALLAAQNSRGQKPSFGVNPKSVSRFRGMNNDNVRRLCLEFGLLGMDVVPDPALELSELVLIAYPT